MAILAHRSTPDPGFPVSLTDAIHGLSWRNVFKIRNTVAWTWYRKFGSRIAVEEFMSEGNLVVAECVLAYTAEGPSSFAHFLYKALTLRMPSVARREWAGCIQRTYTGSKRERRVTSTTYHYPHFSELPVDASTQEDGARIAPVPEPFLRPPTQDMRVFLDECLVYVREHARSKEQVYLWHSLDGDTSGEIGRQHGITKDAVMQGLRRVRQRLTTWAEEVSYAAAD